MVMSRQFLRRARIRNVAEGQVQNARIDIFDTNDREGAERWQDYGFAAQPGSGEGLVIQAGGHTMVLRVDRIAERPQLNQYEVSVWHREGHRVTLSEGRCVTFENCAKVIFNADEEVAFNSPNTSFSGDMSVAKGIQAAGSIASDTDVKVGDMSLTQHGHDKVKQGNDVSGGPVPIHSL